MEVVVGGEGGWKSKTKVDIWPHGGDHGHETSLLPAVVTAELTTRGIDALCAEKLPCGSAKCVPCDADRRVSLTGGGREAHVNARQ